MGWAFVKRRMTAELGSDWQGKFAAFEHKPIHTIIFACDAGMGSSAMGASGLASWSLRRPNSPGWLPHAPAIGRCNRDRVRGSTRAGRKQPVRGQRIAQIDQPAAIVGTAGRILRQTRIAVARIERKQRRQRDRAAPTLMSVTS